MKILLLHQSIQVCNKIKTFSKHLKNFELQSINPFTIKDIPELIKTEPNILVTDLKIASSNKIQFLKFLKKLLPNCKVIVLGSLISSDEMADYLRNGALLVIDELKEFNYLEAALMNLFEEYHAKQKVI